MVVNLMTSEEVEMIGLFKKILDLYLEVLGRYPVRW